jgi:hypothetical protein
MCERHDQEHSEAGGRGCQYWLLAICSPSARWLADWRRRLSSALHNAQGHTNEDGLKSSRKLARAWPACGPPLGRMARPAGLVNWLRRPPQSRLPVRRGRTIAGTARPNWLADLARGGGGSAALGTLSHSLQTFPHRATASAAKQRHTRSPRPGNRRQENTNATHTCDQIKVHFHIVSGSARV